jgi:hypothetical protein
MAHPPCSRDRGLTREAPLATPPPAQVSLLENFVCQEVRRVMGIPMLHLDLHQFLTQM